MSMMHGVWGQVQLHKFNKQQTTQPLCCTIQVFKSSKCQSYNTAIRSKVDKSSKIETTWQTCSVMSSHAVPSCRVMSSHVESCRVMSSHVDSRFVGDFWTSRGAFETHHGQFAAIRHEFVAATLWPRWSRSDENTHSDTMILYQSLYMSIQSISLHFQIILYQSVNLYTLYHHFYIDSISFQITLLISILFYIHTCLYHSVSFYNIIL